MVAFNRNATSCMLEIPEFILGQVPYDLADCVIHVKRALESSRYAVQYVFPRMLIVSWGQATLPSNNLIEYNIKPSGKLAITI